MEEREDRSARFEGVIEDGFYMNRDSQRTGYDRRDRGPGGYDSGGDEMGCAGAGTTRGEVKCKRRGKQYKEKKW